MTILYVNTGSSANKGDGDSIRLAFTKINSNFRELLDLANTTTFANVVVTGNSNLAVVTATNLTVKGDSNFENIYVSGTINVGTLLGYDDLNIIKNDPNGLHLRLKNTNGESYSAFQLLDSNSGGLTLRHQNTDSASPSYESGQVYVFGDTPVNVLNIGRYADLNFFADVSKYTNPAVESVPSIKITASDGRVRINKDLYMRGHIIPLNDTTYDLGSENLQWRSLYVSSSTIYIGGVPLTIDETGTLLVNGSEVTGGGNLGYTGSIGYSGSRGVNGYTGSIGGTGGTGYTGSLGGTGYSGSQGINGYSGSRGNIGDTGYTGSIGGLGYSGSKGDGGNRGYTGSVGFGYSGSKGDTGEQGVSVTLVGSTSTSAGLPLTGSAGQGWIVMDTGDLWFWSTAHNQWEDIGQIVGPQGNAGPKGDQGLPGNDGLPGDPGYTGSTGANGFTGSQGVNGYTGSQGANGQDGYTGSRGISGFTGSQGVNGYTGSQGADGQVGYTGSQGTDGQDGYTGSVGHTGYTGSRGTSGYNGSNGYTGSHGDIGYTGSRGADGTSVTILGSYTNLAALQTAHPTGTVGDAYILSSTGHLAVWNGSAWVDVGSIQGPLGYTGSQGDRAQEDRITSGTYSVVVGVDGTLNLPATEANTAIVQSTFPIAINSNGTQFIFHSDGYLQLPPNIAEIKTPSGEYGNKDIDLYTSNWDEGSVEVYLQHNNKVSITTGQGTNEWSFSNTGTLTLPGGTSKITTTGMSGEGADLVAGPGGWAELASSTGSNYVWVDDNAAYIATNAVGAGPGTKMWTFAKDGNMSAPGNIVPTADNAYDLGSPTLQWRHIYVNTGSIYLGNVKLTTQNNQLNIQQVIQNEEGDDIVVQNVAVNAVAIDSQAPDGSDGGLWYNTLDGRTYVKYSGQWVDTNPVVVPTPETYLGNIAIDGDTLNINGSTLTISSTGTLLVNGEQVISGNNQTITGATITASATDPLTSTGTLWFNTIEGRTYLKYNDQWVDVNPTVVPLPSTYLDEITIDGSTINMNGSTLAINTAGVLLVNGEEVTGSGSGYQLTSGTAVMSIDSSGTVTFPSSLQIVDIGPLVGGMFTGTVLLQQGTGILQVASTGTASVLGWADNAFTPNALTTLALNSTGAELTTGNINSGTHVWYFGTDGSTTFPNDTILGTGLDPNVYIETLSTSTTNTWTFTVDGGLTFPDATVQNTAWTGNTDNIIKVASGFAPGQPFKSEVIADATNGVNVTTWKGLPGFATSQSWEFDYDGNLTFPDATVQTTAWNDASFMAAMATYDGAIVTNTATIGVGGLTVNGPVQFNGSFSFLGTATVISSNSGTFYGDTYGVGALYAGVAGFSPLPSTVIQSAANVNAYIQNNFQNINNGNQASTEWVATANNGDDSNHYLDMGIAGGAWDGSQSNSVGTAASANDSWIYAQGSTSTSVGGNLILGTIKNGKAVKILAGSTGSSSVVATFSGSGLSLGANSSQITFTNNTGSYIAGDTTVRAGSILLQPYSGAGSSPFSGVIVGGSGRLLAPNGSVHMILNANDLTVQVPLKVTNSTAATTSTSGALQVTGGAGIQGSLYVGLAANIYGNILGYGSIVRTGNRSLAAWGSNGAGIVSANATYTDTSSAGTLATSTINYIGQPTLAFSSTTTVTQANTLYISSAPVAGSNATITTGYALNVASGASYFGGNVVANTYVTQAGKPAFRVYGANSNDISTGTTVSATQGVLVDYNQGSYYSTSTGVFTAPVAGLYHCYATVRVGSNNGLNQVAIQKNSSNSGANVIAFWETDTNVGTAVHFSMNGYAKLAVGDTVRLQVVSGKAQFDVNDSWGVTFIG